MNSAALVHLPFQALRILLCTNGAETTRPALAYGVWLAQALQAPVLLLGVVESAPRQGRVELLLDETSRQLAAAGITCQPQMEVGHATAVISHFAGTGQYLLVVGPLGRPAWQRMVQGRSLRRLMEKIETPLLYVPKARLPLKRMLLCLGGLSYAAGIEHLGLYLARRAEASLTLLHVVEPITRDYPTAREIHGHWKQILETNTPQGRYLREALDYMRREGMQVEFKVRHGSAVHEIVDEARQGGYDLLGMGSAYSAQSLRHLYLPNVTAEVAESLDLPVLAVRQGHELVSSSD